MSQHAPLRPSAAYRWTNCPGSVRLTAGRPDPSGPEAEEGIAVHELARRMLENPQWVPPADTPRPMVDAADMYARYVLDVASMAQNTPVIEKPVRIDAVHPDCWGTPDARVYDARKFTLHVLDLKYGHGVVQVIDNPQLLLYAIGDLQTGGRRVPDVERVRLHIVQPRAWHPLGLIRTRTYTIPELREHTDRLTVAARRTDSIDAPVVTGEHCAYCPALTVCPAAREAAAAAVGISRMRTADNIGSEAIGVELKLLRGARAVLEHRLDALEAEAVARINAGRFIPGFSLQTGAGKRKWSVPDDVVAAVGTLFGVEMRESSLVTPAEAERRLKAKGAPASLVSGYVTTPRTAPKLVEDVPGTTPFDAC